LVVNSYENRYGRDGFNGDFVNVALYIPVTVKPYAMLTDSEKVVREQILNGNIPKGVIKKKTMIYVFIMYFASNIFCEDIIVTI
jgi:hypothetical protein